jgi:hypothetical protein
MRHFFVGKIFSSMCSGKYRTARVILDSYQAICFLAAAKAGQAEQGWMVFAALTHHNKLVLPKAFPTPSAWAVVFPCSLLKASFARIQLKKPSTLSVGGFVPRTGLLSLIPYVLRGAY